MNRFWRSWTKSAPSSAADYEQEIAKLREKAPIPALWLFGKTGSGKSSIVRYLTGAEAATIGEGYRPETKTSQRFDFPDSIEPLFTFIDTRGLGEAAYDPQSDIDQFSKTSQLMIVTVRVTDHALDSILVPLRRIRQANPERPVLLALTCLHMAPGAEDVSNTSTKPTTSASEQSSAAPPAPALPNFSPELTKLIATKVQQFAKLHDVMVPIDLTQPADGFADPNFGGERLKQAILAYLPHAYRQALLVLNANQGGQSARQRRARWQVLASSALAGTAGAVPIPWIDIPVVMAVQTHLAMRIAKIYGQEIKPGDWAMLSSATGSRIAMRMAITEALKFIPFAGMAAGAASSFAFTYALGMSWDWYFATLRGGNVPSPEQLKEIFQAELKRGRQLWSAP
ncbi:MAG: 50S ribosome-binding GTPase [Pirellulaceae bacterium]|nr:50S ribosome-binding GTPase [Pirellulaceae bacterium]